MCSRESPITTKKVHSVNHAIPREVALQLHYKNPLPQHRRRVPQFPSVDSSTQDPALPGCPTYHARMSKLWFDVTRLTKLRASGIVLSGEWGRREKVK